MKTVTQRGGSLLQAALPKGEGPRGFKANGLLLRGVVTATYVFDDPGRTDNDSEAQPVAMYCDALVYSSMPGNRWNFIRQILVTHDVSGIHSGRVRAPRAAKIDITGDPLIPDGGSNPCNWDGDHILIGFMEDALNMPVLLRYLPHPSSDVGNDDKDIGQRLRLKVADGDPDFVKHHGSFYGISDSGDFIVDTREAHKGDLETDGSEPTPPGDGSVGNHIYKLPAGAKVTIQIDEGDTFELELKDGNAKLKLGDGAKSVPIVETLEAFYGQVKAIFDAHVQPTAVGPTGVPSAQFPAWDPTINSTKVKIPNG